MKGHLELFENRLKQVAKGLKGSEAMDGEALFLAFADVLGESIPYYDVHSGVTLADYYNTQFVQFVKAKLKEAN